LLYPAGPPPLDDIPSGPSREPDSHKFPKFSIKTALIVVAAVMVTGGTTATLLAGKADKISRAYDESHSANQGLVQEKEELQKYIISLQNEQGSWEQKYQKLMVDRDNLLTQAKRLMNEQSESSSSSELYEKVVKSAIEQNWELKAYLTPLEEKLETLQLVHDDLLAERRRLEQENVYLQERADQVQFEDKINEIESKRKEIERTLRNANNEIKELKSVKQRTEKSFDKIEGRFGSLQEKYAKLLAENKEMRFRDKHLPRDVTIMAKEHQRLIRNLADTHYNMGVLFSEKDDFVRAVKEYKKVIELRPNDTDALYNLGLIYAEHLPDRTQSMEYFNRYLQISPGSRDARGKAIYSVMAGLGR